MRVQCVGADEKHEEPYLDTLGESMADCKLGHVVFLFPQTDEIVVYSCLILPRVVEVEILRLDVVRR